MGGTTHKPYPLTLPNLIYLHCNVYSTHYRCQSWISLILSSSPEILRLQKWSVMHKDTLESCSLTSHQFKWVFNLFHHEIWFPGFRFHRILRQKTFHGIFYCGRVDSGLAREWARGWVDEIELKLKIFSRNPANIEIFTLQVRPRRRSGTSSRWRGWARRWSWCVPWTGGRCPS